MGSAPLPTPAQGSIRLELASLTPAAVLAYVHTIRDGLNGNIYYPELTDIVAALTASENGLLSLLDTLASLEQQLKAIRAAISTEVLNAKDTVRTAAVACENYDRSDEALLSVGWSLKRGPGPAASMTAPTRLTAQPNGFTGQLVAKWSNVANKRFYEVQAAPLEGTTGPVLMDSLATETSTRSQIELKGYVPGSLLSIRVRAIGSKGPGPWCDPITARV